MNQDGAWVSLSTGTANFTLRVDVEDSYDETATTSRSIKVTGSAQYCFH